MQRCGFLNFLEVMIHRAFKHQPYLVKPQVCFMFLKTTKVIFVVQISMLSYKIRTGRSSNTGLFSVAFILDDIVLAVSQHKNLTYKLQEERLFLLLSSL